MAVVEQRFRYEGADGTGLAGFRWSGSAEPKGVLQLAHGAGEHAGRYRGPLAPLVEVVRRAIVDGFDEDVDLEELLAG